MADAAGAARALALRDLGYEAFRRGRVERARQHFARALALFRQSHGEMHPLVATALSDLGVAASALGDDAAARTHHEAALRVRRQVLGAAHPDVAASLHNLAIVARKLGDYPAAIACHEEGLAIWRRALGEDHPAVARGVSGLGLALFQQGDAAAALRCHQAALRIREQAVPLAVADVVASLVDVGDAFAALGRFQAARAAWHRALDLRRGQRGEAVAGVWTRLGVASGKLGDAQGEAACFAEAVRAAPDFTPARHHLAVALARLGRDAEAARHREMALARQCVFVQEGPASSPRVLILAASDIGNVPLEHILPESAVTRIWWFIAHARDPAREVLPPYDVVFNGIGDPDLAGPAARNMELFIKSTGRLVLNDPAHVMRTRRDLLPGVLAGIGDVVVPPVVRVARGDGPDSLRRQIEAAGLAPPLLLRPPGSHGGAGVVRIDAWNGLDGLAGQDVAGWYVTVFVDCRAADGFVRKYRVAFVNRVAYPYHLAISADWMVHYLSADMPDHPWKLREEAAFLADWQSAIGAASASAIGEIGRRLELDFCGIDFSIARDGRVVVFEANATMLIHPESADGPLAFKNAAVQRIVDAMGRHVEGSNGADMPNQRSKEGLLF